MVSVFTKGDGRLLSFCQKRDVTWWEVDRRLLKAGRLTREEPERMLWVKRRVFWVGDKEVFGYIKDFEFTQYEQIRAKTD